MARDGCLQRSPETWPFQDGNGNDQFSFGVSWFGVFDHFDTLGFGWGCGTIRWQRPKGENTN